MAKKGTPTDTDALAANLAGTTSDPPPDPPKATTDAATAAQELDDPMDVLVAYTWPEGLGNVGLVDPADGVTVLSIMPPPEGAVFMAPLGFQAALAQVGILRTTPAA